MLIGANSTYKAGSKGGAASHVLTQAEMPSHSHGAKVTTAGAHTHTRGSMNIKGTFPACVEDHYMPSPTGAFFCSGTATEAEGRGHNGNWLLNFDASRSWSGETTANGDHTHTITMDKVGQSVAHNNMQPYLSVYMWQRIQ